MKFKILMAFLLFVVPIGSHLVAGQSSTARFQLAEVIRDIKNVAQGGDDRAIEVPPALHAIPALPWLVVSQVGTADIYVGQFFRSPFMLGPIVALLILVGMAAVVIWRRIQRSQDQVVPSSEKARKALQEGEAFIRTVLDNLPVGVAANSVDPTVAFSYMNDNFVRYYRTTREALASPDALWEAVYEDAEFREVIKKEVLEDIASRTPERMYWEDVPITRAGAGTTFISARNIPIEGNKLMLSTVWDTTARKHAEEELRKLSWAVEHGPSMVYITGPDGRLEYVNPKFAEITGYTFEEALGRLPRILDPDKLSPEECRERWDIIRAGHEWRGEFHNRKKNGESFWERASISSIKDAAGSITHLVLVMEDITARKQAEEALRASEERFRVVAESAPDAIISIDSQGKIIFWNHVAERVFGYSVEEAIGEPFTMIMPEHVQQIHRDSVERFLSTGQSAVIGGTAEMGGRRRDGTEFPVELSVAHWESGGETFFTAIMRDITERKQAEQALRQLNEELEQRVVERTVELDRAIERMEAILNSSSDIVILCRTNGTINQVNPAFDKAFGYISDEAFNQRLTQFFMPDHAPLLEQAFETVVHTGQAQRLEVIAHYKEDPPFDADVVLSPVVGPGSQLLGVICSLRDVTRQKQMETQLRQLLAHEMELSELKSRYVAMAAHDLRNPLAVIQSTIELIQRYSSRLTGEKLQEKYDDIQASIDVMVTLLDDILTLGRIESGKLGFEPTPLDVIAFCKSIVAEMKQATGTTQSIYFSGQGDGSTAWLDAKLLRHILGNLLSNAIKYSPDDRPVILTMDCEPNRVIFRVQDQGIGIPGDDQRRLFEAFHRASNAQRLPGTGLGLAIVKESVDLHGGTITFESQEGIGTTFIVTLPQATSSDQLTTC
jgi:PAS domain S-box-containing protein